MTDRHDAIVVGAGPAGSAAAFGLARAGARVALVDAASFPRSKPCGDCISPGATPFFEALGVRAAVEDAGAERLVGWRTRTPAGTWFEGRFGGGGWGDGRGDVPTVGYALPRRDLDALLVEAAVGAGARLREGVRVFDLLRREDRVAGIRARGPDGRERAVRADLVIGADGLRSVVARRLDGVERGPRPRLAIVGRFRGVRGARRGLRGPAGPVGEMRLATDGCLGLAPVGRGRWNVTLVVPASDAGEISSDRHGFFHRHLERYGVADRFRDAEAVEAFEITGPFETTPRKTTAPGVLLAGDAGGYFDPLTGQGVHRALATGRAAARAGRALLAADRDSERSAARHAYEREQHAIVAPSRRVQKLIDGIVSRRPAIEAVGRLMGARPALASLLVDVTGDRLPARALLDPRRLGAALVARPDRRAS